MANMQTTKTPMPEQDANVRNHNFDEVALGYTAEMAVSEAQRCLQCKKPPCVGGCPVNVRIPEFIAKVAEGDFMGAYEIITSTNALPALSGRVCPQETQCEAVCVRGKKGEPVAIGRLERFVADWYMENVNKMPEKVPSNGKKVAVVGSGPAGLTCASDLAKKGYEVTMFEALHTAGGVLVYGIPEFRLPKAIVQNEVDKLEAQGVKRHDQHGHRQGPVHRRAVRDGLQGRVCRLRRGPAHVHGYPRRGPGGRLLRQRVPDPRQPDEGIPGRGRHPHHPVQGRGRRGRRQRGYGRRPLRQASGRRACVHRLPPRRGRNARPCRGAATTPRKRASSCRVLCNPVEILNDGNGRVGAMKCVRMELGEPDASGRRRPVEIPGSEFELPVDTVIMSLGTLLPIL